ncbi:MAG: hypothetical protein ACRD1K_04475 [Acidimicrobiales bacterium]
MLSERFRGELRALADGPLGPAHLLDRLALAPFLVGVHRAGEEVVAHDLAVLVDEAGVPAGERDSLLAYIEAALHLLEAYDRSLASDEDDLDYPGDDLPYGTFVI